MYTLCVQAAIEGMGIMLQKNMAPPPAGMPSMNMPEAPKPAAEVLIGGSGGPPGGLSSDPNVLLASDGTLVPPQAEPEGSKSSGWFPSGLFS